MAEKRVATKKRITDNTQKSGEKLFGLEQIYAQYLSPMPLEQWSQIHDLSQPSLMRQVPTRTAYSSFGATDA